MGDENSFVWPWGGLSAVPQTLDLRSFTSEHSTQQPSWLPLLCPLASMPSEYSCCAVRSPSSVFRQFRQVLVPHAPLCPRSIADRTTRASETCHRSRDRRARSLCVAFTRGPGKGSSYVAFRDLFPPFLCSSTKKFSGVLITTHRPAVVLTI